MPRQFFTNKRPMFALAAALLVAGVLPNVSRAALGQPESSIQADVAKFQGKILSSERLTYRVHEITLPSGTVVREFVSQSGTIFAVSWQGPYVPNLRQALGQYFDNYVATAKTTPMQHRRIDIEQPDLIVHAAGHMRAFSGIAYLPQAVPSGVSVGDLR